jgi:hypothetical protein
MPSSGDARHWQHPGERTRAVSEQMTDYNARQIILGVALAYNFAGAVN